MYLSQIQRFRCRRFSATYILRKQMFRHIRTNKISDSNKREVGSTVKLRNKEQFDKKQIGVKKPFPVTNCQFTS